MAAGFVDAAGSVGRPGDVHATAQNTVGTIRRTADGNEYIYLKGVTGLIDGDFVGYKPGVFTAVRLVAGFRGPVAIATGVVDTATKCGWFCIAGSDTANVQSTVVSNANLYATASAGLAHSTIVKNDQIKGATTLTAAVAAQTATVALARPFVGSYDESA